MSNNLEDFDAWRPVPTYQPDIVTVEKIKTANELIHTYLRLRHGGETFSDGHIITLFQDAVDYLSKQFREPPLMLEEAKKALMQNWNRPTSTTPAETPITSEALEETRKKICNLWGHGMKVTDEQLKIVRDSWEKPSDEIISRAYGVPCLKIEHEVIGEPGMIEQIMTAKILGMHVEEDEPHVR